MPDPDPLPRLERRVDARSHRRFLEVTGRRAALLGNELGLFEAWIWPLKVLRELEVCVRTDTTRRGRDLAREVAFQPDRTEVLLVGPDFRVRQTLFAALDRRATVILCHVESERDLELQLQFVPGFEPMWPAALGGKLALRDQETGAFALTEELGRFAALLGSPEAEPLAVTADHALPREPLVLRVPVTAKRARRGPVPLFLAGAEIAPAPLSQAARVGEEGAASGHARSHEVLARARDEYRWIAERWRDVARELEEHWRDFLARTTHFESDDARHTEAFLWAKIAIEKAWVEVDGLGRGLVAGLAPSGASERPGFGWFFDGDALVASRAMVGYGDRKGARRVLDFAASHQRADGKLMHELVLSARLCNWIEDFPYAYYKAQLTPGFIAVLGSYVEATGDREFLQQMWPIVLAAYRCCVAHLESDGHLSNRTLGIAAVEAGSLVAKIRAEIYLQGIWISALRCLQRMASALRDAQVEADACMRRQQAEELFESFWSERAGRYGFAHLVDGALNDDSTSYQALPLSRSIGDAARARASAAALNRPNLASDWGVRLFAADSSVYDTSSYNTGSVFPYTNNFATLAQFENGLTTSGHQLLASAVALHGFSGLGFVPEHLRADRCATPARGVPHQIFSSACIVQSTMFGMLGIEATGARASLRVSLPARVDRLRLSRIRHRGRVLELELRRERCAASTRVYWTSRETGTDDAAFSLRLRVPPLSRCARPGALRSSAACTLEAELPLVSADAGVFEYESGPELVLDDAPLAEGSTSSRLRVCEVEFDDASVVWTIWGLAGTTYRVGVRSDRRVRFEGAERPTPEELAITFPAGPAGRFVSTTLRAIALD